MRRRVSILLILGLTAAVWTSAVANRKRKGEPDRVTVQHVLIGFKRSVPGKRIERTRSEAQALAHELLERAEAGEDFDSLVEQYTDDSHPGIYRMTNFGVPNRSDELKREAMVTSFGDVSFGLQVGEIGVAKHNAARSKYGWHLIKRLE